MTGDIDERRRFYAEEIEATSRLRTPGLVEALARVARERFLGPGPWLVRGESDFGAPPRPTPDADPKHVYHNLAIAIDPARQLFNGQPGLVTLLIDALALAPGARALHLGCGTGYYTALMAHVVGPAGRVIAVDVDEDLAARARANLSALPQVEVAHGDGTGPLEPLDAILVNAGVTHPLESWLDALAPGGRLVLPLTVAMDEMGPTIGKGPVVLVTRGADGGEFAARVLTFVAIFSAVGLRDLAIGARLADTLKRNPFPRLARLRRDAHDPSADCWLHAGACCLSLA